MVVCVTMGLDWRRDPMQGHRGLVMGLVMEIWLVMDNILWFGFRVWVL